MLKRRKQQFEIDYDKLAEAIVKAQEKADKETIKQAVIDAHNEIETQKSKEEFENSNSQKNENFRKVIWEILRNKRDTGGKFTAGLFSFLVSLILKIFAVVCLISSLVTIAVTIKCGIITIIESGSIVSTVQTVLTGLFIIVLCVAIILFMIIVWGASNEIDREQDKNYVVSVFSGIVSLSALVVAVIALVKGVVL
ncbi:MAG: hypothetical protein ACI4IR_09330 [Eubacterium sp.]